MSRPQPRSEMPGVRHNQRVISEGRISMPMIGNIGHACGSVPLDRKWNVAGKNVFESQRIHKARINIYRITWTAESIAFAECIMHRQPLDAPADADKQSFDLRGRTRDAATIQILIGD